MIVHCLLFFALSNSTSCSCEHCDEDSCDVFRMLLERMGAADADAPLLIVLAMRCTELDPENEEPWRSWLGRDEISLLKLGCLDDLSAAQLVKLTVGGGDLPDDVLGFILKHCQGVPLQLEQERPPWPRQALVEYASVSRHASAPVLTPPVLTLHADGAGASLFQSAVPCDRLASSSRVQYPR